MYSSGFRPEYLGKDVVSVEDGVAGRVIQENINLAGKTIFVSVNLSNGQLREGAPELFRLLPPTCGEEQKFR
jgi:hypothetical protein